MYSTRVKCLRRAMPVFVRSNAYFIAQTTSLPHLLVLFPPGLVKTLWTRGISVLLTR